MTSLILLGGGGHAAVAADAARSAGFTVLGYVDDDQSPEAAKRAAGVGLERLGSIADVARLVRERGNAAIHAAVGDAALRRQWLSEFASLAAPPIVHASAVVSPSATIADGAFIGPRAVVNARARIGRGVIVNTAAVIEHDCMIEPFAHIAPGSTLCGQVHVGEGTLVGAGTTVIPRTVIGSRCTIGAGSVVVRSISDDCTALGVPARLIPQRALRA